MASHARPKLRRVPRGLLRAGLAVSAAGAALAAGGAAAHAAPVPAPASAPGPVSTLTGPLVQAVASGVGPVKSLQLDPLANSAADPLNNAVGTRVADFKPVSTTLLTGALSNGGGLKDLPLVGQVVGLLPG
ncbi:MULTISPECIES: hypothetical protein [Streptomyces]|uniref:ATP-binding protein n=2 Tax=Streptomyces TaxID=1883 RepID=A0A4Q9HKZ7_STRKA|nr:MULTISPECIES: hypothetical protein [Streptomyces]MYU52802.1 hypothetical protein [Streptomyces sp. SID7805]TBO55387.1 hypothetical protein EYS09_33545 [Streptomyces kasugaensis]WSK14732.1 hypothetical protein OG717_25055 [Streptomyces celluloflavus]